MISWLFESRQEINDIFTMQLWELYPLFCWIIFLDFIQWRTQGVRGVQPPPPNRKKLLQKNVISEGSIFSSNFSNKQIKMPFSIEFSSKIYKIFSKNSQPVAFFIQTRKNVMHTFESFLKNMLKQCIFAIFLKNFLQIFENSPAPRWLRSPDNLQGRP